MNRFEAIYVLGALEELRACVPPSYAFGAALYVRHIEPVLLHRRTKIALHLTSGSLARGAPIVTADALVKALDGEPFDPARDLLAGELGGVHEQAERSPSPYAPYLKLPRSTAPFREPPPRAGVAYRPLFDRVAELVERWTLRLAATMVGLVVLAGVALLLFIRFHPRHPPLHELRAQRVADCRERTGNASAIEAARVLT